MIPAEAEARLGHRSCPPGDRIPGELIHIAEPGQAADVIADLASGSVALSTANVITLW